MALAQFLAVVRGEIDNRECAACFRHTRRFCQNRAGFLRIVQHLMEQDRIERRIVERQQGEVALDQIDQPRRKLLKPRAGDLKHLRAAIERGDVAGVGCEQLGHAARPGADIEQRFGALGREDPHELLLDRASVELAVGILRTEGLPALLELIASLPPRPKAAIPASSRASPRGLH